MRSVASHCPQMGSAIPFPVLAPTQPQDLAEPATRPKTLRLAGRKTESRARGVIVA